MARQGFLRRGLVCGTTLVLFLGLLGVLSVTPAVMGQAAPAAAAKPASQVVVLDTLSVWHMYAALKLPVVQYDDGLKPIPTNVSWLNHETAEPPTAWKTNEFDDSAWLHGSTPEACHAPLVARLYLRGQFEVSDPAKVGDLHLTVGYHGGAIVYLNGQEVARGHLPKGPEGPQMLAESYPVEAYISPDGKLIFADWRGRDNYPKNLALRERALTDVILPQKLLHKGVNLLAIEIIRAPYNKIADQTGRPDFKPKDQNQWEWGSSVVLRFATCDIGAVQLTAANADGLAPNAGRPAGVKVWNSDVLALDYDTSIPDRCELLRPVTLAGARNGWFSGKVVLSSPAAIKGLKATAGDLKQGDQTIPAAQVRVRYAAPGGNITDEAAQKGASQLGYLLEAPLAEFPVSQVGGGAVVPIWITVKVPKDAKAGSYTGQVTLTLEGSPPIAVPVKVDVADWTLPDTQDYKTWVDLVESPDTLAVEYKLDLWSDKHFAMVAQAMDYIGEISSRMVYVPLICGTNFGNAESMVRWIKKADGTYDWDFSIMDRYLDMAEKHMGQPKIVVFQVWDSYVVDGKDVFNDKWFSNLSADQRKDEWFLNLKRRGDLIRETQAKYGISPQATVLDPVTKKVEAQYLFAYDTVQGKPIWQKLFVELKNRMQKRGLEKAMMIGMISDSWPTKEQTAAIDGFTGGLPWVVQSHGGGGPPPVGYSADVFHVNYLADLPKDRVYGWKRQNLSVEYRRFGELNTWPPATLRNFIEMNITGTQRGLGRIGADFWAPFKDKKGERSGYVWGRYPQSLWRNLDLYTYVLAPGPNGPVATNRYEYLREGLEECEARIAIERALTDESLKQKLGPELLKRCEDTLEERSRGMVAGSTGLNVGGMRVITQPTCYWLGRPAGHAWFLASGWQARQAKLFALAGDVAAKLGEAR
jgi:hypothetical protein